MKTILDTIVEHKKREIQAFEPDALERFKASSFYNEKSISFKGQLGDASFGLISEFKRRSPSKPEINLTADPVEVGGGYEKYGTTAISVLTDLHFFGGSKKDFDLIRKDVRVPMLRKDFIVDPIQVHETKAMGADLMLLIASCLSKQEVVELGHLGQEIGLQVLLELHGEEELDYVNEYVDLVGVNNRNLKTFEVDLDESVRMANQLPLDMIKVAESGLKSSSEILMLMDAGFRSFFDWRNLYEIRISW